MDELPDLPLGIIVSYLDPVDVARLASLSSRLNVFCCSDRIWASFCRRFWLSGSTTAQGQCWYGEWRDYCAQFGRYRSVFAVLRRSLNVFASVPRLAQELLPGASEDELDVAEKIIGRKLPLEVRCWFRLCNGQRNMDADLLGSFSFYQVSQRRALLSLEMLQRAVKGHNIRGTLPLAIEYGTGGRGFIHLIEAGSVWLEDWNIAPSWSAYLARHADVVCALGPLASREISLFPVGKGVPMCVTRGIRVTASPLFIEVQSSKERAVFSYHIRIEAVSPDAPRCKLRARHWVIDKGDGGPPEVVDGPGVIGLFPTIEYGMPAPFSYESCCFVEGSQGHMEGHFTMVSLDSGEQFNLTVPRFNFVVPLHKGGNV